MNPVGKKRRIEVKLHILSYSTGGFVMVSGLFSSKNFVKILIFRFTIFIFVFFKTKKISKKKVFLYLLFFFDHIFFYKKIFYFFFEKIFYIFF